MANTQTVTMATTCKSMAGGVTAEADLNQSVAFALGGAWATGDQFKLLLTALATGSQTLIGFGNVTGQTLTFLFTLNRKLYALAGSDVFFSAIDKPTAFNDLNGEGNSFVALANTFANPENAAAMMLFQGKLAFLSRRSVQIWNIDADPDNWSQAQVLENIGTFAAESAKRIGEWEGVFLADSGFRSLRARVATDNAEVNDLGSPIDILVQAKLAASNATQKAAAAGVVEPNSNRYWCFINDTIYVLSYFPSAQIVAWSTYLATYESLGAAIVSAAGVFNGLVVGNIYSYTNGTAATLTCGKQVIAPGNYFMATATTAAASDPANVGNVYPVIANAFTPQNFVVLNGQVFTRDTDALYAYGGADGNTYDGSVVQADTPFLDMQNPAAGKDFYGIDVAQDGSWAVYIGTNIADKDDVTMVYSQNGSSYANGVIPINRRGTHIKIRFKTTGNTKAVLSKGVTHFGSPYEK